MSADISMSDDGVLFTQRETAGLREPVPEDAAGRERQPDERELTRTGHGGRVARGLGTGCHELYRRTAQAVIDFSAIVTVV
ncbi:hypothetical protein BRC90_10670 [Halobacteriales archaeon QS_4_69_34]|nr:MAG: hypothetical protein BRC90_10670 [Halobacteriales archaeon QS_4_69_34]